MTDEVMTGIDGSHVVFMINAHFTKSLFAFKTNFPHW